MAAKVFGWIPPALRTTEQQDNHEDIIAQMPAFALNGPIQFGAGPIPEQPERYPLWYFGKKVLGRHIKFSWQLTGSCVGSNGANAVRVLQCVEIAAGEPEGYERIWWPWTYGQSRKRAGIGGEGEGSFGSAYAEALVKDGMFFWKEKSPLPDFTERENWLVLTSAIERQWSNGARYANEDFYGLGRKHLVKKATPIKNVDEAALAIKNGTPLTIASMFGTKDIRPRGNPSVNIGSWSDQWPHQQWIDEVWEHPTEGRIFRWGNDWGDDAHPAPTQGEPVGGFYTTDDTLQQVLSKRDTECYALWGYDGWQVRDIWYI